MSTWRMSSAARAASGGPTKGRYAVPSPTAEPPFQDAARDRDVTGRFSRFPFILVGAGYATLNLNVGFLRPITQDSGAVRCVGTVVSMGSRVAVAEAELIDATERKLARATATCLLTNPDPARS